MANVSRARAWVEVDPVALRSNYLALRHAAGAGVGIIPMVKADAYGTGVDRAVRVFEPLEPWGYGVATVEEGVRLRALGVRRPVLVFTPLPPEVTELAARHGLTATISDLDGMRRWSAAVEGLALDFHVEIDTGMGRTGFDWRETADWAGAVRELAGTARWTGAFTHFHSADAADRAPSAAQWERFQDAILQLPVSREELLVHASNSAAALRWPEFAGDLVRPGIFLYGGHPAPEVDDVATPELVVTLRARILMVRDVPPGTTVGYGATHVAQTWTRWGTLGIGYGDGVPRTLANRGSVLVRGLRCPMVGRISMDSVVVDLSLVPDVGAGETATLIGRDGEGEIKLEEFASTAGTISYEALTGLGARLPRVDAGAADE